MNGELVLVLLKFGGMMLLIMMLIMGVTILTPVIAKKIDKTKDEPSPERVEENIKEEEYTVKGPYDKQKDEDFDPNYKIYNTDIYGAEAIGFKSKNKENTERNVDKNG